MKSVHILVMPRQLVNCLLQTIENTREKDETVVAVDDAEVQADEAQDEFAGLVSYRAC